MKAPSLTLGVEEEYQIIDPETRELSSYITKIMDGDQVIFREVKPELHQSVVEMGTEVCQTPAEVRDEIIRIRRTVMDLAAKEGLKIVAAASHPFSSWTTQEVTPLERYVTIQEDLRDVALKNLIFGMHVHVGIEDREFLIDAYNVARYFMPHVLCLTTSSPFWLGRNTGLKSYRSVVFRNFPRSGIPREMRSWAHYESLIGTLVNAGTMDDGSKIWWDVRPHFRYPTLEFRNCDICTRVDEAVAVAALYQAIVAKLWKLRRDNLTFRVYPVEFIEDNKWRAVRYGLDGDLIDFGKGEAFPAKRLIREIIEWFVDDVVDELGSRKEIEYAFRIMDEGASADRQVAVFEKTGDLKAVVDHLIEETAEGVL